MNFKYVFGFLSLICLSSGVCARKWQNKLALHEALRDFVGNEKVYPLLGKDVAKMSDEEKKNICNDAAITGNLEMPPQDDMKVTDVNLEVDINDTWFSSKKKIFSVFSCDNTKEKTYFFGKGPSNNTIAVYVRPKNEDLGAPLGIIDYSWKWYKSTELINALKYYVSDKKNYPFLGKDVSEMNDEEKMKICTDFRTERNLIPILPQPQCGLTITLAVGDEKPTFSVCSCFETEDKVYYFGKGPCANTIAFYSLHKRLNLNVEVGIIEYSSYPQQ